MSTPKPVPNAESEQESLEKEASHTLEEARMVLPGMQALFGFQLVAVYNQPFKSLLSAGEQHFHLAGLLLTAAAIALLMTPAAYHRQAEPHEVTCVFLRLSRVVIAIGMFMLMLSIQIDCCLIARIILHDPFLSAILTALLGGLYLSLWFVLPRWARRHRRKARQIVMP